MELCEELILILLAIFFDLNILTIATGMPEHDPYALKFIEATKIIKKENRGVGKWFENRSG